MLLKQIITKLSIHGTTLIHDFVFKITLFRKRSVVMLFISMINALLKKWIVAVSKQSLAKSLVQQENQVVRLNNTMKTKSTISPEHSSKCCDLN